MPIHIIRQDITKMTCDAIVNPSNEELYPGGGVDALIHEAAGEELTRACRALGGVRLGHAKLTAGYNLPCKYVIHTAGPVWCGGGQGEEALLTSCYTSCLQVAAEAGCESLAFPLISSGLYGYPKDRVMKVAIAAISDFLMEREMEVYVVVFDKTSFAISERLFAAVTSYVDDRYACDTLPVYDYIREERNYASFILARKGGYPAEEETPAARKETSPATSPKPGLKDMLGQMDKGFAATLFELIDKSGMTDVECYKRANVDKKTFSKIKCNKDYKPSKATVLSFAVALRLTVEETNRLLGTVGFTLSHSSRGDTVVEYFLSTGNYKSIFDVNEVLWKLGENGLGV